MDRFTGSISDPAYLCRPVAAGAKKTRRVDPGLPKNYSSLIAESIAEMISIRAGNVLMLLWLARLPRWVGATFMVVPTPCPAVESVVASASAT